MYSLFNSDNIEILKEIPDNFFSSVVTDPPYGIKLLNKKWDYQIPSVELWKECLRVLKPGGHLLSFCGTRTQHRMAVNIEDAGFEIRDVITWIYGQGMPKSYNVTKAINKLDVENNLHLGLGTALKPAAEFITIARKPISEKNITLNVLRWGTGAIQIDESRIELNGEIVSINVLESWSGLGNKVRPKYEQKNNTKGRWPANLIFDEEAADVLDKSVNVSQFGNKSPYEYLDKEYTNETDFIKKIKPNSPSNCGDTGGVSRFFYVAKVNKREKNAGCNLLDEKVGGSLNYSNNKLIRVDGTTRNVVLNKNIHPSVKPIKLMEHLVNLVTPKGGICLDPFLGSGTTVIACNNLGFDSFGIELNTEYLNIAKLRIKYFEEN